MYFNGLTIVPSPLAIERTDRFTVERIPIKKRRKGWRVAKTTTNDPAMIVVGKTAYIHPTAYAALKGEHHDGSPS